MSADNYYWLTKRTDGKWVGVMRFASDEWPNESTERASFECDTLEEAIRLGQREYTEYGVVVDDNFLQ